MNWASFFLGCVVSAVLILFASVVDASLFESPEWHFNSKLKKYAAACAWECLFLAAGFFIGRFLT